MSKYSNFVSFIDYTDFSFFKSLFWGNNDKKENDKKEEKKDKNKNKIGLSKSASLSSFSRNKYSFNEKQKKLILKLEAAIENYLYRKKIKNLIKTLKDNYMIISTANIPHLFLNIIRTKGDKQYKLKYEPILKQNVAFLPRKIYRNKKKLKFTFANIKKEIFIEPQYQTEYEDGSFVNVLDLQDLKEKEYKNEEDFQKFLADYIKNKNKKDEKITEINEKKEEIKVEENKVEENKVEENIVEENKVEENIEENTKENNIQKKNKNELNKKKIMFNIKLFENKQLSNDNNFNIKVKRKNYKSKSLLKHKDTSLSGIKSILKERKSEKKLKIGRQISFGTTQFSY